MKLIGKYINKDRSVRPSVDLFNPCLVSVKGYVNVRPEDDEDMWHLYNLIQEVCRPLCASGSVAQRRR